jgi:hypothetical protein
MLKTPKNARDLTLLLFLLYATLPLFELRRIDAFWASLSGAMVEELGIFIILGAGLFWIWGWIALLGFCYWSKLNYLPAASIFAFDRERMFRSVIYSVIFGYFFFNEAFFALDSVFHLNFLMAAQAAGLAYALLCIRTLIVFKKE